MAIDISAETRRVVYTGSAGTGPYAFAFNILVNTDIAVYYNATELTLTTDYTVSISADGTGSVTIITGTNVPTTPDADDRITLIGDRTIERSTDFTTGGPLFAQSLNDEFDSLTIFTQQNLEQSNRSLRAPNTDPTTIDMTLPINTVRANKTLAFDNDGNPTIGELIGDWKGDWAAGIAYNKRDLIKDTTNDNVYICQVAHTSSGVLPISSNADSAKWDLVVDAASAAAAQAAAEAAQAAAELAETNAETAETNAETAETNAAASASAASTSATNAATSESNAASSASTASTAATNAGTSETNAASSASAASTSASSASTSASTATTQASNASASASTATTQAGIATTQASNASTSATNAASSASAASSSASAASTSETNAATSETNAAASATSAANSFDSFDDRYLGAKSSAPTLDNDGNALITGALYWNSTTDKLFIWTGSAWNPAAFDTTGAVLSFNSRTGAVTLTSSDVTDALTSGSVATDKIADDAITTDKLANSINAEIAANTAKVGITTGQASAITANTAKVGITTGQADAIVANTAKVTNATHTGDVTGNTALTIADSAVTAPKLNAGGSGTSGQVLESNGDGSMAWTTVAAGGGFTNMQVFTSPGTWTNPGSVSTVKVTVVGAGGGAKYSTFPPSNAGGTSSFGAFCSATGGGGAYYTPTQNYAEGGVGSGGNLNLRGGNASLGMNKSGDSSMGFGAVNAKPNSYTATKNAASFGGGGACLLTSPAGGMHGGGGGTAIEYIDGASIPGPVAVTVGSKGTPNMPGPFVNPGTYIAAAGDGIVIIEY